MAFLTDRKRAVGLGSAKSGVEHFWAMKKSSIALLILVPFFVFTFGGALGGTYEEVLAYYSRPFPAIIAALTIIVGFHHFNMGVQVLIEDYVHGLAEKVAILLMTCLSYGAAAVGVFAIAKLAL
ncbi:succinate dehydrogenase, hydrophobic membrane anchor protein [Tropicibacter naphthalenivorans]|uniref:Succinate dehydrogenase hydrophobic membrane anchor subunit n=1 Tax=Tropicibacter naphthalenivorans TaxID=441103 RepID=A0A0P1GQZ0_9RHOB|nr:succinate dehydrogenase, hydrophobic membrane anchor protein [Tropicibacter naphthalenivorans]CUH77974.1 succinate dehydrogenase, hydrophobic membrane anchor protein [Tropicibacter naphthalenivorans]SMC94418.1 succinate dehydrogenase subunit D [Tropicibacter naphthalenivorans]